MDNQTKRKVKTLIAIIVARASIARRKYLENFQSKELNLPHGKNNKNQETSPKEKS